MVVRRSPLDRRAARFRGSIRRLTPWSWSSLSRAFWVVPGTSMEAKRRTAMAEASGAEPWAVTAWGELYEIFPEVDPLVAGQTAESHTHVTALADFSPLTQGDVAIVLRAADGSEEIFRATQAKRPGIFAIEVTPQRAGDFDLLFRVDAAPGKEEIPGGRVRVGEAGEPGRAGGPAAPHAARRRGRGGRRRRGDLLPQGATVEDAVRDRVDARGRARGHPRRAGARRGAPGWRPDRHRARRRRPPGGALSAPGTGATRRGAAVRLDPTARSGTEPGGARRRGRERRGRARPGDDRSATRPRARQGRRRLRLRARPGRGHPGSRGGACGIGAPRRCHLPPGARRRRCGDGGGRDRCPVRRRGRRGHGERRPGGRGRGRARALHRQRPALDRGLGGARGRRRPHGGSNAGEPPRRLGLDGTGLDESPGAAGRDFAGSRRRHRPTHAPSRARVASRRRSRSGSRSKSSSRQGRFSAASSCRRRRWSTTPASPSSTSSLRARPSVAARCRSSPAPASSGSSPGSRPANAS